MRNMAITSTCFPSSRDRQKNMASPDGITSLIRNELHLASLTYPDTAAKLHHRPLSRRENKPRRNRNEWFDLKATNPCKKYKRQPARAKREKLVKLTRTTDKICRKQKQKHKNNEICRLNDNFNRHNCHLQIGKRNDGRIPPQNLLGGIEQIKNR